MVRATLNSKFLQKSLAFVLAAGVMGAVFAPLPTFAQGRNFNKDETSASAKPSEDEASAPIDLTTLIISIEDNQTETEESADVSAQETSEQASESASGQSAEDASSQTAESGDDNASPALALPSTSLTSSSGGLKRTNPTSIRLASLGNERDAYDGLDRLMWEGSDAATILKLHQRLIPHATPRSLRSALHHVIESRSVPPSGFLDLAQELISLRLNWIAEHGASEDLAELIRQLPDAGESQDWGQDWGQWLALHNLMIRQDEEACSDASKQVMLTLEKVWHQINAFCSVIAGDEMKAAFALDILEDSGVDDPMFFALMRQLTGDEDAGEVDQTSTSTLNLILLDSARISVAPEALNAVPTSYRGSVQAIRYLSPAASRLIEARKFNKLPSEELTAVWALAPAGDISAAEALTRLRFGGDADTLAMARLNAWQAISSEKDDRAQAQLALEALVADYAHAGPTTLALWLGFIEGGADDQGLSEKIGPILGFAASPSKILLSDEALAWHHILTASPRPVSASAINGADAHDAIPLLMALGQPIEDQDWLNYAGTAEALTTDSIGLAYAELMALETAAANGLKAETLLRSVIMLQEADLGHLSRADAARVVGALKQAGLTQSARNLAEDIMKSWGLKRHLKLAETGDAS